MKQIIWNVGLIRNLEKLHLMTDNMNFKILNCLVNYTEGITIRDISLDTGISYNSVAYRVKNMVTALLVSVEIKAEKFETDKFDKRYISVYMLKPTTRRVVNTLLDTINTNM